MTANISPIPSILDAILSGWKTSKSLNFSPVAANFIGFPVIFFTDNAAPPRVSPSNFVRTIPSIPTFSLNVCATFTASWPVIESTTNSISCGFTFFFTFCNSSINASSICKRPAVSNIITSFSFDIATLIACFAICTTSLDCSFAYTGIFNCAPTTCNCLIAAGL